MGGPKKWGWQRRRSKSKRMLKNGDSARSPSQHRFMAMALAVNGMAMGGCGCGYNPIQLCGVGCKKRRRGWTLNLLGTWHRSLSQITTDRRSRAFRLGASALPKQTKNMCFFVFLLVSGSEPKHRMNVFAFAGGPAGWLTFWFGFTHAGHDARCTVLLCVSLAASILSSQTGWIVVQARHQNK